MKAMIQLIVRMLAVIVLIAFPITSFGAPPHTGIQGQAYLYISYGTPVEIEPGVWIGIPSVQLPVATAFTVLAARSGREIARVVTDSQGSFSVSLHPGDYILVPEVLILPPACSVTTAALQVRVNARAFTPANIFYFREGPCTFVGTAP